MQGALWTKELQWLSPREKEKELTSPHSIADTILRSTGSGPALYSHAMERITVNRDCYSWPTSPSAPCPPPKHLLKSSSINSSQTFLVIRIACSMLIRGTEPTTPWEVKKKVQQKYQPLSKNLLFYQGLESINKPTVRNIHTCKTASSNNIVLRFIAKIL